MPMSPEETKRATAELVSVIRRYRLDYDQFRHLCRLARSKTGLKQEGRRRRLPVLLTDDELAKLYDVIDRSQTLRDTVMLRLLLVTGVRVSELVSIRVEDVYWRESKIFIERGKGDKDRYILFPDDFGLVLRTYTETLDEGAVYLFESRQNRPITPRRVRQLLVTYAREAGISKRVHPHLLRHQILTWLTRAGLPDSAIQLISGHASKKSLEVYQHMSLDAVDAPYQEALKKLKV